LGVSRASFGFLRSNVYSHRGREGIDANLVARLPIALEGAGGGFVFDKFEEFHGD